MNRSRRWQHWRLARYIRAGRALQRSGLYIYGPSLPSARWLMAGRRGTTAYLKTEGLL